MTPVSDLLAHRAFALGREGRIAETVAPLLTAEAFGGADKIADIRQAAAWALADQAMNAAAAGRTEEAGALASLGLCVAENIRCLYCLCVTSAKTDRAASRYFSQQLIDVANRTLSPDRWAAFRYILSELLQPDAPAEMTAIATRDLRRLLRRELAVAPERAEAKELMGALEAAIGPEDLPTPTMASESGAIAFRRNLHRRQIDHHLVYEAPDLALSHCAAVLRLGAATAEDNERFRNAAAPFVPSLEQRRDDPADDEALAILATVCFIIPDLSLTASLIGRLSERGDTASLAPAIDISERAPFEPSAAWISLQFLRALSDPRIEGQNHHVRDARACEAVIARISEILAEKPPLHDLRLARCQFLLSRGRDEIILADLSAIIDLHPTEETYRFTWDLMQSYWDKKELDLFQAAARIARRAPMRETPSWFCLVYLCELAACWGPELETDRIAAAAGDAMMLKTNDLLARSKNPISFRFQRMHTLMIFNLYKYAASDLFALFDDLKDNPENEALYSHSVARNIFYLKIHSHIFDFERLCRYMLGNDQDDLALLRTLYLFCAEVGRMDVAYKFAERASEIEPKWRLITKLKDFLNVKDAVPAAILERPRRGKNVIYANIVCWGEEFIEKMAWGSPSSLLSEGNIPLLAENNDIVFDFVTHVSGVSQILSLPEITALSRYCEIRIYCLPDIDDFFTLAKYNIYFVFGHAQHFTVLRAQQDNADVLLLSADVVNANGNLAFVNSHVSAAPRAIFYDGLNCSLTPVRAALQRYRTDGVLTVDAKSLLEVAVRNLKPIAINCFFESSGASHKFVSSMIYVRKPFGFRVYSASQALVYASAAALQGLAGFDCLPVEGRLSGLLLEKLTPAQVVTRKTSEDYLWIELDDDDRLGLVRQSDALVTHVDAVTAFFRLESHQLSRFTLFDRPVDYHAEGLEHGDVIDDETEAAFLAELEKRRRTDPIFTELCAL